MNTIQSAARKICERLSFNYRPFESESFRIMLNGELGRKVDPNHGGRRRKTEDHAPGQTQHFLPELTPCVKLNDYIELYIEQVKSGKRLTDKGKVLTDGSRKNYLTFQSQFNLYQSEKKKKINFEDIDQEFHNDFILFLNGKNYSPNTIGKHIARQKKILRSAKEENLYQGQEHEKKYFKALEEDTEWKSQPQRSIEAVAN